MDHTRLIPRCGVHVFLVVVVHVVLGSFPLPFVFFLHSFSLHPFPPHYPFFFQYWDGRLRRHTADPACITAETLRRPKHRARHTNTDKPAAHALAPKKKKSLTCTESRRASISTQHISRKTLTLSFLRGLYVCGSVVHHAHCGCVTFISS